MELVLELAGRFIVFLFLLPVCLLVATPAILLRAAFRPGHIRSDYKAVVRWWDRWGVFLT